MISENLNFPLTSLKGIGKRIEETLFSIDIHNVADLLEYYPRDFSDRRIPLLLKDAIKEDKISTVKVTVTDHLMKGKKYNQFLKVLIHDSSGYGALLCFNRNFLQDTLLVGRTFYITGRFQFKFGEIQCSSFDYEEESESYKGKIVPIYPLTSGLTQNVLRKSIEDALNKHRLNIDDELPQKIVQKRELFLKRDALKNIHFPDDDDKYAKAKRTLNYENYFFQKLFLLKRKERLSVTKRELKRIEFRLKKEVIGNLPFQLTSYQKQAIDEIEKDLFSEKILNRLLQGDVGSGKTIVAILSMLSMVEAGYQVALMAPTEILAIQHYNNIKKLCDSLWIDIALLTSNISKKDRDKTYNSLKNGDISIVIGTHSLFSSDVTYKNLGFVVIDEQQRFGVEQRYALTSKGEAVNLLMMTATPIPQSLALTLYGDLDVSVMKGTIDGRIKTKTWVIDDNENRIAKMHEWIRGQIENDGRALIVYPLIEDEEDTSDNKNLIEEYEKLKKIYKNNVSFIHSKLPLDEKNIVIDDFRSGKIKVLASTTIVEVGLDIPEANVIVVENANMFGLSTLHQLRGRVGRNNQQGFMILIADNNRIGDDAKKRLKIIESENDGFRIAEEDLLLRGPGDFIGARQSGLPNLKYGDIRRDLELIGEAFADAEDLYNDDPKLSKRENQNTLLSLIEREKKFS